MAGQVFQGVEGFLGHSSTAGSAGFLKNWKEDGQLDVVLHPRGQIAALWSHRWHRVVRDKESGKERLTMMRFNSMESERTLTRQHFRGEDGSREYPPEVCPFSKTLEWVREAVENGDIDWTDEIFEFKSDGDDITIQAGGFTGLFQKNDLDDEQLGELKKAKVRRDEAYKQNCTARLNYVFCVVQYEVPEDGCVIAMEGKALGQKMQKAIRDERAKWEGTKTPEKGDPFKKPFVFRWKYDSEEKFDRAYDVIAMPNESLEITAELQAVFDEEPPSIEKLVEQSNVALLRQSFEEHWVHEVVPPWDDIFGDAEERVKGTPAGELPEDFNHGAADRSRVDTSGKKPSVVGMKTKKQVEREEKQEAPPPPPADEEEFECDNCQAPMKATELTCKKCGTEYDSSGNIVKKPEPAKEEPKRRSRSESKSNAAEGEVEAERPKRRR